MTQLDNESWDDYKTRTAQAFVQNYKNSDDLLFVKVSLACNFSKISLAELARRVGTSPQNFHRRLRVGKFTIKELQEIAAALGGTYSCTFTLPDGTTV